MTTSGRVSNHHGVARFIVGVALAVLGVMLSLVEAAESPSTPLVLGRVGRLLAQEDFRVPLRSAEGNIDKFPSGYRGWRFNLSPKAGRWEQRQGAFYGSEILESRHPATASYGVRYTDAIIECEMRLEGSDLTGRAKRTVSLRITHETNYVCGVLIEEGGIKLRKEDQDHGGPDKLVLLADEKRPIARDTWHRVRFEICGDEVAATMGEVTLRGRHPAIKGEKHSVMFLVGGDGAIRNLRIWEEIPR